MSRINAFRVHTRPADAAAPNGRVPGRSRLGVVEARPAQPSLTGRELECLCWCAEGKSYWESGTILGICERTVSFHMEAVRAKLGADSNAHAVAMAFRTGVLRP